jgi:hypothetical protein
MYCPKCRSEYEPGIVECADCRGGLVENLPVEPERGQLVLVFETDNPAEALVVESLLDSEKITHVSQNEMLQDFFGIGRLGPGYNPMIGLVRILVAQADEKKARQLLEEMRRA